MSDDLRTRLNQPMQTQSVQPVRTVQPTQSSQPIQSTQPVQPTGPDVDLKSSIKKAEDSLGKPAMDQARKLLVDDLKRAKDKKVNMMQWASLGEKLISGITKFSAAKKGLDLGLDMSSAEIERTDWDKKIGQILDDYSQESRQLLDQFDRTDAVTRQRQAQLDKLKGELQRRTERRENITTQDRRLEETRAFQKEQAAKREAAANARQSRALGVRKLEAEKRREIDQARLGVQRARLQLDRAKAEQSPDTDIAERRLELAEKRLKLEGDKLAASMSKPDLSITKRLAKQKSATEALQSAALTMDEDAFQEYVSKPKNLESVDPKVKEAYIQPMEEGLLSDTDATLDAAGLKEALANLAGKEYPLQLIKGNQRATVVSVDQALEAYKEGFRPYGE